jgi:uncharacterized membrane protein YgdD (TMEM256/DUF423 family)
MTRVFACFGALYAMAFVILSALANHRWQGLDTAAQVRLDSALTMLIVHGLALLLVHAFALHKKRPALGVVSLGFFVGTMIFSGSLLHAALNGSSALTKLAPFGGGLLIFSWLLFSVSLLGSEVKR